MKKPIFGGLKKCKPDRNTGNTARVLSGGDDGAKIESPALRDVWCACTVYSDFGSTREGVVLGISDTHARVRFPDRATLSNSIRIKASRIGLNRPARVTWQDEFDAALEFIEHE